MNLLLRICFLYKRIICYFVGPGSLGLRSGKGVGDRDGVECVLLSRKKYFKCVVVGKMPTLRTSPPVSRYMCEPVKVPQSVGTG